MHLLNYLLDLDHYNLFYKELRVTHEFNHGSDIEKIIGINITQLFLILGNRNMKFLQDMK